MSCFLWEALWGQSKGSNYACSWWWSVWCCLWGVRRQLLEKAWNYAVVVACVAPAKEWQYHAAVSLYHTPVGRDDSTITRWCYFCFFLLLFRWVGFQQRHIYWSIENGARNTWLVPSIVSIRNAKNWRIVPLWYFKKASWWASSPNSIKSSLN